jgi:hypothetical protein
MLLYHGSDADQEFEVLKSGVSTGTSHRKENNVTLLGVWMTPDKAVAEEYAQGMYTYTCQVELGNVLDLSNSIEYTFESLCTQAYAECTYPQCLQNVILQEARENGYDTVIFSDCNRGLDSKSYVVLNEKMIKILEVE